MRYHLNQGYSRGAIWAGYALAALYFVHSLINVAMPRTDKLLPMRETLRGYHYMIGTLMLITVIYLLIRWFKDKPVAAGALSPAAHRWTRALALTTYCLLLIVPFLGFVNAWTHGLPVHFGPLPALPSLIGIDRNLWVLSGYFHTAPGFSIIFLGLATMLTAAYVVLRYGVGLVRAFPPGFGLFAFASFGVSVYASVTFSSPEPGPRAIALYLGVCAIVWLISRFVGSKKTDDGSAEKGKPSGIAAASASLVAVVITIIGLYGPAALFRVNPFNTAATVEAPEGITWHQTIATSVEVTPETAFERDVAEEHFKWCGFCHTYEQGKEHLLGPNLYGIFGQEIASVPNFPYTEAFVGARAPGRVWTDELMMEFIANPDAFAPGTTMVVSSGNVTDREKLMAMVNLLKKRTMPDALIPVEELSK